MHVSEWSAWMIPGPHVIDGAVDPMLALSLSERLCDLQERKVGRWVRRDGMGPEGERDSFWLADKFLLDEHVPEIVAWYDVAHQIALQCVGYDVIKSPFEQSSVNARIYRTGDNACLHRDTQPVSCLLYLSYGEPLKVDWGEPSNGTVSEIEPRPGRLVFFEGKRYLHWVEGEKNKSRVAVVYNFYTTTDCERPDYIDELLYSNANYAKS